MRFSSGDPWTGSLRFELITNCLHALQRNCSWHDLSTTNGVTHTGIKICSDLKLARTSLLQCGSEFNFILQDLRQYSLPMNCGICLTSIGRDLTARVVFNANGITNSAFFQMVKVLIISWWEVAQREPWSPADSRRILAYRCSSSKLEEIHHSNLM